MASAVHGSDKAISAPRQSLDEARTLGVVIQRRPQSLHGIVEALLEVHERVGGPQFLLQLFSADDLAGTLQQHGQDLHRLALQSDLHSLFVKFSGPQIKLEDPEAGDRRG